MSIKFSWDEAKSKSNEHKHGLRFEIARLVFDDPLHLTVQDRIENGQMRWQTLGLVDSLLIVAHTWDLGDENENDGEEHIRIISARRATKRERRIYEENT